MTELVVLGLATSGIAAGFINTVAGGGSLLTLPALMLAGMPADIANGSNRLCIVTQSVSGVTGYARAGRLPRTGLMPVVLPAAIGALVGSLIASRVPAPMLEPILLAVLVIMALVLVFRPALTGGDDDQPALDAARSPSGIAGLFLGGVYGGFIQAGVGFVLLAVLTGVLRHDLVRANALKLVCTTMFGVVALAVFVAAGQVQWAPAAVLAVATVIGSQLGVRFALKVAPKVLRGFVLLCVLGACAALVARM